MCKMLRNLTYSYNITQKWHSSKCGMTLPMRAGIKISPTFMIGLDLIPFRVKH